jgi:hypothetical protein
MSSGFDFSLYARDRSLELKGSQVRMFKTGTSIAAVIFQGGVILGADTRSTAGDIVSTKTQRKIHYIAENILCCGAGTSADTDQVTQLCAANLRLFGLNTGLQPRVEQAAAFLVNHLFDYWGHVQASLVLAGADFKGSVLRTRERVLSRNQHVRKQAHNRTDRRRSKRIGRGRDLCRNNERAPVRIEHRPGRHNRQSHKVAQKLQCQKRETV